jgi:hypothetical protein
MQGFNQIFKAGKYIISEYKANLTKMSNIGFKPSKEK